MKRYIFILFCSVFTINMNSQSADVADKSFLLRADLGFCHWYADDLRTSTSLTHPTIGIGFKPGLNFPELRIRYAISQVQSPTGGMTSSYNGDYIHFFSCGFALRQTFYLENQRLIVHAGLNTVCPVIENTVSFGGSLGVGMEYMFNVKPDRNHSLGIFMEVRNQSYRLRLPDGRKTDLQYDLVLDLGIIVLLWK